ncbi:MAG TPA: helix-turn-helix domain-containing protein [bacterium]|jgi:AcrR family transcriptional regulator|nr:helix-turn-helix domain-containing protein [bacterium]
MRTLDPEAHAQVRARVLDAARRQFAARGYHAASMNEVARSAGLAKAALYHYFKGKRALLQALHEGMFSGAEDMLAKAPHCRDLREALDYLGRSYLAHFKQPGPAEVMRIALNVAYEDPDLLRLCAMMPRMEALLDAFLRPHFPKGTSLEKVLQHLMPFFGSLFYYRFVLMRTCTSAQLPAEAAYLGHLVDVFSAPPRGQKRRPSGSVPKKKSK